MILAVALALLFAFAASSMPTVSEKSVMEQWSYNPQMRRKILYNTLSKAMADEEAKLGKSCEATNWSLENFIDRYLEESNTYAHYKTPDNWTNNERLFRSEMEDYLNKIEIDENKVERNSAKTKESWTFKNFIKKYEGTAVWDKVKEESLILGRNETHDRKFFSLIKGLDSTDEVLSLEVPRSGRRWWNNQWPMITKANHRPNVETDDFNMTLYFIKQIMYQTREKLRVLPPIRDEFRATALYKMGFLFAKTDHACKVFSSLAYKSFRQCSMIRTKIYDQARVFLDMMDIVYNIERLEDRWFDVDILKDLLVSNDLIVRHMILKDKTLTTPEMIVKAFDDMFID